MIEKYKELNDDAKRNLLMELENITNDGKVWKGVKERLILCIIRVISL